MSRADTQTEATGYPSWASRRIALCPFCRKKKKDQAHVAMHMYTCIQAKQLGGRRSAARGGRETLGLSPSPKTGFRPAGQHKWAFLAIISRVRGPGAATATTIISRTPSSGRQDWPAADGHPGLESRTGRRRCRRAAGKCFGLACRPGRVPCSQRPAGGEVPRPRQRVYTHAWDRVGARGAKRTEARQERREFCASIRTSVQITCCR